MYITYFSRAKLYQCTSLFICFAGVCFLLICVLLHNPTSYIIISVKIYTARNGSQILCLRVVQASSPELVALLPPHLLVRPPVQAADSQFLLSRGSACNLVTLRNVSCFIPVHLLAIVLWHVLQDSDLLLRRKVNDFDCLRSRLGH